jgi:divalent metal cation (Fe/Co/Zn/Cd) transporter
VADRPLQRSCGTPEFSPSPAAPLAACADAGKDERRQQRALQLIAWSFVVLANYLSAQSILVLAQGYHARHSLLGIVWTAATAAVMFTLAAGKRSTGLTLGNAVLATEGRVTMIDGILASAVLLGLVLNAAAGWWWADPAAGLVIVYYAIREATTILIKD